MLHVVLRGGLTGQLYGISRRRVNLTNVRSFLGTRNRRGITTANGAVVTPFKLADIGEGIAEVELLKWYIKKG